MSLAAPAGFGVNRVRVVDREGDALRARLAADRLLNAAQPTVPGLPAGSILVVRRLGGAMPAVSGPALSPAGVASWRLGVESALGRLWRTAARPGRELVPVGATAVLFDDGAELLACLIADWAAGVAGSRWWWPALLSSLGGLPTSSRSFAALLRSRAAHLPAAFELLARRRLAERIVRAIPAPAALSVAVEVAREHRVAGACAPVARAPDSTPVPSATHAPHAAAGRPSVVPPWEGVVPEAAARGLAPAQRMLLGVALMIRRDPVAIRRRGLWRAVEGWWSHAEPSQASALPHRQARWRPAAAADAPVLVEPTEVGSAFGLAPVESAAVARVSRSPSSRDGEDGNCRDAEIREDRVRPLDAPGPDVGAWTPLAGIFYLLNVALFLGLYGDFASPRDRGISLDPWDCAALIGRRLLPGADPRDRIWALLAGLAVHDRPGAGFRAPRCWRAPRDWLEPFEPASGPWRPTVTGDRLRAVHPAGFVAIDVPASEHPPEQLQRELARIGVTRKLRPVPASPSSETTRGTARWVGWVAEYLRARLRIALGARTAAAAVAAVLERPGTVHITPTRVDVNFDLDDLPVAIRLAGLDRSPGWIPAAGRHLEFHFE